MTQGALIGSFAYTMRGASGAPMEKQALVDTV